MAELHTNLRRALVGGFAAVAVVGLAGAASAQGADVLLGDGVFPESIAATTDGGLITGSVASPNIYRWNPGDASASVFATVDGITLGVFAAGDTVYACRAAASFGDGQLLTFDNATGAATGTYPMPGGGLCNDIAIGPDGSVFVTDTGAFSGRPGGVHALVAGADGAMALQPVFLSSSTGGADGLAFLGSTLYVNDVMTGKIFALELDGTTLVSMSTLTLSRELSGPDGMRAAVDGSGIYVAENAAGRVSFISPDGTVATVAEGGWVSATGVAEAGGTLYVIDTHFPDLGNADANPGPFMAFAVAR